MELNEHEMALVQTCEAAGLTFVATTSVLDVFRGADRRDCAADFRQAFARVKEKRAPKKPVKPSRRGLGGGAMRTCDTCGETKKAQGSFRGPTCKKCLTNQRAFGAKGARGPRAQKPAKEED